MIDKILRKELETIKNPVFAKWQEDYLRNQFPFLGVKTPILKKILDKLRKEFCSKNWKEETLLLWSHPEREFHHAAIMWARFHIDKATQEDLSLYETLITTKSWWDTVDTLAPHLVGMLAQRFSEIIPTIESWRDSDNLWLKRTSIIYPLCKRKTMDSEKLFATCQYLNKEKDFFIRKAIGWVLREHSKFQPEQVQMFVKNTTLSPLSKKEALRKIPKHLIH